MIFPEVGLRLISRSRISKNSQNLTSVMRIPVFGEWPANQAGNGVQPMSPRDVMDGRGKKFKEYNTAHY
jgi:hypothetical protein